MLIFGVKHVYFSCTHKPKSPKWRASREVDDTIFKTGEKSIQNISFQQCLTKVDKLVSIVCTNSSIKKISDSISNFQFISLP